MRRTRFPHLVAGVLVLMAGAACRAADRRAEDELRALGAKVKRFRVVDLPRAGETTLKAEDSLTVEDLRGVALDEDAPVLGAPAKAYPPSMADDCPPGQAPYVARDIRPFRFRHFHCEFNYGGWHTWNMAEYASAHGFDILSAYNHAPADWAHVPAGTQWLSWGGAVNWEKWLPAHQIPAGRYDLLAGQDVVSRIAGEAWVKHNPQFGLLMLDVEHGLLAPEALRKQEWYPAGAGEAERAAFEARYYEGFAHTHAAPVLAARQAGWKNISIYGWQPFPRTWFGLEKAQVDPATHWAWNAFGKRIYEAVDLLNPSVYCFYWSPQNVAYTLANIDLNLRLVNSMPRRKPLRPYYWTLLHGGGGGSRWWANQPLPDEEARAMTALGFFTGFDGLDTWNWSGTGSHVAPPPLKAGADVMLKDAFARRPEGAGEDAAATAFARYDVLHVQDVSADGAVRFQRVDKSSPGKAWGLTPDRPVYAMPKEELAPHLRASAEPVAATIEGMALVKPFEYHLRHGEVKVDVPAQEQYSKTLPIVRRVKLGSVHVLATYDPMVVHGGKPREVVLPDFDGATGRTLRFPADEQTRVFVVREK